MTLDYYFELGKYDIKIEFTNIIYMILNIHATIFENKFDWKH